MSDIDKIIMKLFSERWLVGISNGDLDGMKAQLYKNLSDQVNGFWSGHTAYNIMVDGGFIVDSKRVYTDGSNRAKGKRLTELGKIFIDKYNFIIENEKRFSESVIGLSKIDNSKLKTNKP